VTEEEAGEVLALLDQLDNQDDPEEVVDPQAEWFPKEEWLLRRFGMTRAEILERIPVLEEEIKTEALRITYDFNHMNDILQNQPNLDAETRKWCAETHGELQKDWRELVDSKILLYKEYKIRTIGTDNIRADLAEGGWIQEMQSMVPDMVRIVTVGQLGPMLSGGD